MISALQQNQLLNQKSIIYNDNFGYLTTHLSSDENVTIINQKSQLDAIKQNGANHKQPLNTNQFKTPFDPIASKFEVGLIKIPKSLELFEMYVNHACQNLTADGYLISGFMTKHFTKQLLTIGQKYFEEINQTKAWKKSRLLILKKPKPNPLKLPLKEINSKLGKLHQHFGVFSSGHIDYATSFLIENINLPGQAKSAIDLASGNGILGAHLLKKNPTLNLHLVDDSFLAIESSKLNLPNNQVNFHHHYNLNEFDSESIDYIISNPPFHLEHEIDLDLPHNLFKDAHRVLSKNGTLQIVANSHLKYQIVLKRIFKTVEVSAQNPRFTIFTCRKI